MDTFDIFGEIIILTSLAAGGYLVYEHSLRSYEPDCLAMMKEHGSADAAEYCSEDCQASNLVRMVKTGTAFSEAYRTAKEECRVLGR